MDKSLLIFAVVTSLTYLTIQLILFNTAAAVLNVSSNATGRAMDEAKRILGTLDPNDTVNATERAMNETNRLIKEAQNAELDPCIINPSSDICNIIAYKKLDESMCETLPLSDLCSKSSENKARVEANAPSIISKCLNDPLSIGCTDPMIHLIKTCESLNYLLDYCDKEKLIKSTFYDLYEKEQNVGR